MNQLLRGAILLTTTGLFAVTVVRYLLFAVSVPLTYDYIIVGGGSTGSVVAGRLGQAGYSVLVLEAGGPTQNSLGGGAEAVLGKWTIFDIPLGWVQVLSDHRWSKEYQWDVPADPPPAIARGLGGCGIHNAMLYMRGRPGACLPSSQTQHCTGRRQHPTAPLLCAYYERKVCGLHTCTLSWSHPQRTSPLGAPAGRGMRCFHSICARRTIPSGATRACTAHR